VRLLVEEIVAEKEEKIESREVGEDQSHGLDLEFLVVSEVALKAIRASKSGFA
jgi:hypothetical protein